MVSSLLVVVVWLVVVTGNQYFLACIARRVNDMEQLPAAQNVEQFVTKQDLTGKILACDTRLDRCTFINTVQRDHPRCSRPPNPPWHGDYVARAHGSGLESFWLFNVYSYQTLKRLNFMPMFCDAFNSVETLFLLCKCSLLLCVCG